MIVMYDEEYDVGALAVTVRIVEAVTGTILVFH